MTIIDQLYKVLQERKDSDPKSSYVSSLYAKGAKEMSAKIREEAEELIDEIMALDQDSDNQKIRDNLKNEAADLIFHLWVALAHYDVTPDDIGEIFKARFGTSGHDEKASRGENR